MFTNFHISPEMQALLEPVLTLLITTMLTCLTGIVALIAAWVQAKVKTARAGLTNEQRMALDLFVGGAIKAAEQMGLSKQIEDTGKAKKQWVIDKAQAWCDANHIAVDANMIEVILEGKILEGVHKGWRQTVYTPEVPVVTPPPSIAAAIGAVG